MLYKTLISKELNTYNIYSLDSKLRNALVTFAFCCQLISGFTEWLGIAPFLIDLLKPFLTSSLSNWIGNGMAIALALFLEFLVYYLVGFVILAVRQKYWALGQGTIDKIFNKIKFWSACILLAILVSVSMFLSKRNVKLQVATTTIEVETTDLDQFDTKQKEQITDIETRYNSDKKDLDDSYKDSKILVQNSYSAKIAAIDQAIKILERKEQRTGKSYISKKTFHRKEIAELRTLQAEELQQLRQKYDKDLATLKHNRSNDIYAIADKIKADRGKASKSNDSTAAAIAIRNEWISMVLQWIASLSVLGFVVARSWVCMSDATAGMTEKAMPLQENFGSNFWKEFYLLCRLKMQRKLQNKIRTGLAAIPDLIQIEEKGALYSLSPTLPEEEEQNYFEQKKKRNLAALFSADSSEDLTKDDPYDFTEFSKNLTNNDTITKTVEIPPTSNENEISATVEHNSRVHNVLDDLSLGEKNISKNDISNDSKTVVSGQIVGEKNCLNCGEIFQYKNKKKKYCSDACRIDYWEKKNGKKLKKGKAKSAK